MVKNRLALILAVCALVIICGQTTALRAATVQEVVNQVSQANYYDLMWNKLYTHTGNSRAANGGAQHEPAAQNIFLEFRRCGLTTYFDPFVNGTLKCKNVVAIKPGVTTPNVIYILGAHYDSTVGPGADDNASGVAGVLESARAMAKYKFAATIIYVAFDNEEGSHGGSLHMAAEHQGDNIQGMISADMLSCNLSGYPNHALIYGASGMTTTKQQLADAITAYGNGITWGDGGVWTGSDHNSFLLAGFPAAWLYEAIYWGNGDIHSLNDNSDRVGYLDYTYATNMTKSLVGWLATQAGLIN